MIVLARFCRIILIAFAALALTGAAMAAPRNAPRAAAKPAPNGPPNALQGFSQNRDQPVHIKAAKLEVRDKQQIATFSGDVRVKQGDTDMRCRILKVYYEREKDDGKTKAKTKTIKAATPGPGGAQKIKRLEAIGSVVVTQKDQTASGKLGIFDMKSNTVTLTGDVVMTQGQNVLRGDKLVVNLTTGVSRVESGKGGSGRVEGLFMPSGEGQGGNSPLGPLH
jgi:lipopolysaccharide export system protein LptA